MASVALDPSYRRVSVEAEMAKVANEGVTRGLAEGKREPPKVPLKDDDAEGGQDYEEHGEGGLSAGETGVEEGDAGNHHHDQTRAEDDVCLVTGLVPLVEVLGVCEG